LKRKEAFETILTEFTKRKIRRVDFGQVLLKIICWTSQKKNWKVNLSSCLAIGNDGKVKNEVVGFLNAENLIFYLGISYLLLGIRKKMKICLKKNFAK